MNLTVADLEVIEEALVRWGDYLVHSPVTHDPAQERRTSAHIEAAKAVHARCVSERVQLERTLERRRAAARVTG